MKDLIPPIFLLNLKAYIWGREVEEFAKAVNKIAKDIEVTFIIAPQLVDVYRVAQIVDVPVFAPTIDPIVPGRGVGKALPEAIKEAGAMGVLVNHSENQRTLREIRQCILRAHELGLKTLVCADSPESSAAVTLFGADIVLSEPPELIGTLRSVGKEMADFLVDSVKKVKEVNNRTFLLAGAGIASPEDAAQVIRLGADGLGASRIIYEAKDRHMFIKQTALAMMNEWRRVRR